MVIGENEFSTNQEQYEQEGNELILDYLERIKFQLNTVNRKIAEDDILFAFFVGFLNLSNVDEILDRSILISDSLNEYEHSAMREFFGRVNNMLDTSWGISIIEPDPAITYYIYQTLVTKFTDYFLNYVNGLQKLDVLNEEDIENWNELRFETFKQKNNVVIDEDHPLTIPLVTEYLDTIVVPHLLPELYYEIGLLGSEGNTLLSDLVVETVNQRLSYDREFIRFKIERILSSEDIRHTVINRMIDIL